MDPTCTDQNVPGALRLHGNLDPSALAGALRIVSSRHDALRTRIVPQRRHQGAPAGQVEEALQVVAPPDQALVALVAEDAGALPAGRFVPHCSMCAPRRQAVGCGNTAPLAVFRAANGVCGWLCCPKGCLNWVPAMPTIEMPQLVMRRSQRESWTSLERIPGSLGLHQCMEVAVRRPEEVAEELPLPVLARIQAEAATPFDLERGPLVRARLIRLAPEDHLLLLTMHHSIADGWSVKVRPSILEP